MMKNEHKLYKKTKSNDISIWTIYSIDKMIYIETKSGIHSQAVIFKEYVDKGKAGRSVEQQIQLRINSRIKKKKDGGCKETIEEARNAKELHNQLNLPMPMLAERFDKIDQVNIFDCFIQRKYDGHRCLIARVGNELIAYSRNGIQIHSIDHILKDIQIPDGYVLDGELYHHGTSLQTIGSWVKRKQANTLLLKFVCYDIITPDKTAFIDRYDIIRNLDFKNATKLSLTLHRRDIALTLAQTMDKVRNDGYEGLILRPQTGMYSIGRRTKSLIKVKRYLDAEFEVIAVSVSKSGLSMIHMMSDNGVDEFKATAPGNRLQNRRVQMYPSEYIGNKVTLEYANLTDQGIPFQPIATRWLQTI